MPFWSRRNSDDSLVVLSEPPDDEKAPICADIIIVQSGSNLPRKLRRRDQNDQLLAHLPPEIPNARVLLFQYTLSWQAHRLKHLSSEFLRALGSVKTTETEWRRPTILIGRGFGGIILKQAVLAAGLHSYEDYSTQAIFGSDADLGFIFLGTPHRGARLTALGKLAGLCSYWQGRSSYWSDVLQPGSFLLEDLQRGFVQVARGKGRGVGPMSRSVLGVFEARRERLLGLPVTRTVPYRSAVVDDFGPVIPRRTERGQLTYKSRDGQYYEDIVQWIKSRIRNSNYRYNDRTENGIGLATSSPQQNHECLKSLYSADLETNIRGHHIADGFPGTCSWLFQHDQLANWLSKPTGVLWLGGSPGSGKSTLMKHAVEWAERLVPDRDTIIASFFIYGRGVQAQKSELGFFSSLVYQIIQNDAHAFDQFAAIYDERYARLGWYGDKWTWSLDDLQQFIVTIMPSILQSRSLLICVDALDEMEEPNAKNLVTFFENIMNEKKESSGKLHLTFSCRSHHVDTLSRPYDFRIRIEEDNFHDIEKFVTSSIDPLDLRLNPSEAVKLWRAIIERAGGIFQWVSLAVQRVVESRQKGINVNKVLAQITDAPPQLFGFYKQILLDGKDEQELQLALRLFQWLCFSLKPLQPEELRYLLNLEMSPGATLAEVEEFEDAIDSRDIEARIKSLSSGLATVVWEQPERRSFSGGMAELRSTSRRKGTVRLIHQSVYDYMLRSGLYMLDRENPVDVVLSAHKYMAITCLRYLHLEEVRAAQPRSPWVPPAAYDIVKCCSKCATSLPLYRGTLVPKSTPLPGPSRSNLSYIEEHLKDWCTFYWILYLQQLEQQVNVAGTYEGYIINALQWPSNNLIEQWIDLAQKKTRRLKCLRGSNLLHIASHFGLLNIVRTLLCLDPLIEVNTPNATGLTPLGLAERSHKDAVVEMLLSHDYLDASTTNNDPRFNITPLHFAAMRGDMPYAMLLLRSKDVDVDAQDVRGCTPLIRAVQHGHRSIVELLLWQDSFDINHRNYGGRTALIEAARTRSHSIVKLLTRNYAGRLVDPNIQDLHGDDALSWAVRHEDVKLITLLLAHPAINPNSKDPRGQTPLHRAVLSTSPLAHHVVKALLSHPRTEPDRCDPQGRSPLFSALHFGLPPVISFLVSDPRVPIDKRMESIPPYTDRPARLIPTPLAFVASQSLSLAARYLEALAPVVRANDGICLDLLTKVDAAVLATLDIVGRLVMRLDEATRYDPQTRDWTPIWNGWDPDENKMDRVLRRVCRGNRGARAMARPGFKRLARDVAKLLEEMRERSLAPKREVRFKENVQVQGGGEKEAKVELNGKGKEKEKEEEWELNYIEGEREKDSDRSQSDEKRRRSREVKEATTVALNGTIPSDQELGLNLSDDSNGED